MITKLTALCARSASARPQAVLSPSRHARSDVLVQRKEESNEHEVDSSRGFSQRRPPRLRLSLRPDRLQRSSESRSGNKGASFVLTPLTPGAIKPDTGTATFCCWTERSIMRDGQAIDINDPRWTLTGKLGTIVGRNQIGFVDLPDGWAVFTGHLESHPWHGRLRRTLRWGTRSRRPAGQRHREGAVRRLSQPEVVNRRRLVTTGRRRPPVIVPSQHCAHELAKSGLGRSSSSRRSDLDHLEGQIVALGVRELGDRQVLEREPVESNRVMSPASRRPSAAPMSTAPSSVTSARATAPDSTATASSPP